MKKRLIAALMAAALAASAGVAVVAVDTTTSTPASTVSVALPVDVATNAWYKDAAQYVLDHKLMALVGGKFEASTQMTREDIADVLLRGAELAGVETLAASTNVRNATDYATIPAASLAAVSFCYDAGIMTGDDTGKLNLQNKVTRAELSKMLSVYAQKLGMSAGTTKTDITKYTDYASIRAWAYEFVQFCADTGMVKGDEKANFNPNGNITRAEFAQIMLNISEQLPEETTTAAATTTTTSKSSTTESTTAGDSTTESTTAGDSTTESTTAGGSTTESTTETTTAADDESTSESTTEATTAANE